MAQKKAYLFMTCLMLCALSVLSNGTYYLDAADGNDNNSGISEREAWKSLRKINNTTFRPGDVILLKRNRVYDGSLLLIGSGKQGSIIKLSAYGAGRRPLINATGRETAIRLMDAGHWVISDIETTGGEKAGIFVGCSKHDQVIEDIKISNCYVHDIGDSTKPDWELSTTTGGIIVVNGAFDEAGKPVFYNSVINNILIRNCIVRYNQRWTCISISSGKPRGIRGNSNSINNCIAEYSAADGIRMNGVQNSTIEYCVMYKNGSWPQSAGNNLGGLGAWFFDAENCTIQYCEASYVGAKETDGGAFDIDYWQKNSTVQYCYGHHCAGYGVSVFGADNSFPTENSVVCYNIFANNGRDTTFAFQGDFFVFTWNGGLLNGVKIHDNISFWEPSKSAPALKFQADFTGSKSNSFTRNTIYSGHPWMVSAKNDSLRSDSNLYRYPIPGKTTDPGAPVWEYRKEKYYSLQDWKNASGLDRNSRIEEKGIIDYSFIGGEISPWDADLGNFKGSPLLIFSTGQINDDRMVINDTLMAQLAFIKSMERQYGEKGLKVLLLLEADPNNNIAMMNFLEDHELMGNLLITINSANKARENFHGISNPTTFLVSKEGLMIRKWENLALPAQLGFAIELILNTEY